MNLNKQTDRISNEVIDGKIEKILSASRCPSQTRHRTLLTDDNSADHSDYKAINASSTVLRKPRESDNDLQLFQLDDEQQSTPPTLFLDAHCRTSIIDSREASRTIPSKSSNETDDDEIFVKNLEKSIFQEENSERMTRKTSKPIPIEPKPTNNDTLITIDDSNLLIDAIFSQSAPTIANKNIFSIPMNLSNNSNSYMNENFPLPSSVDK